MILLMDDDGEMPPGDALRRFDFWLGEDRAGLAGASMGSGIVGNGATSIPGTNGAAATFGTGATLGTGAATAGDVGDATATDSADLGTGSGFSASSVRKAVAAFFS